MKVLMLNGSCHLDGTTNAALTEIGKVLNAEGIDYEIFQLGGDPVRDCIGCRKCNEKGCIFDDDKVNEFVAKAKEADGLIFGTPVYYAHPSGRILSFMDRVFYSSGSYFRGKPGVAIAAARRGGTTASLDVMNKYFGICHMPTVGSSYWNMIHGACAEDIKDDLEGLQAMRNIGHNMAWLIKSIEAGKATGVEAPVYESGARTNFVR